MHLQDVKAVTVKLLRKITVGLYSYYHSFDSTPNLQVLMTQLPDHFFIKYREKKVMVSILTGPSGNYFTVHLDEGNIRLKSAGLKRLLWLEKGKGATGLAYQLGQLIEQHLFVSKKLDN